MTGQGKAEPSPVVLVGHTMSTPQPIPLTPIPTAPGSPEYQDILTWPFANQPFYEGQVIRLVQTDIPHLVLYSWCRVWVYRDPNGNAVGFGTLEVCKEYEQFTNGQYHSYIPLLAVHPSFQNRGHGGSIVGHLTREAQLIFQRASSHISDILFLDVYTANQRAISLYGKCGFATLNPNTLIVDPDEGNQPYVIMAKKMAAASTA